MNKQAKTRHEREVSDAIHDVAKWVEQTAAPGLGRSCKIERELYYDQDGSCPSRFLEYYLNPRTSVRVAVQRNEKRPAKWTCYWTVFASGRSLAEGEHDGRSVSDLRPLLLEVIGRYDYLRD